MCGPFFCDMLGSDMVCVFIPRQQADSLPLSLEMTNNATKTEPPLPPLAVTALLACIRVARTEPGQGTPDMHDTTLVTRAPGENMSSQDSVIRPLAAAVWALGAALESCEPPRTWRLPYLPRQTWLVSGKSMDPKGCWTRPPETK